MARRDEIEDGSGWGGLVYSTPEEKEVERLSAQVKRLLGALSQIQRAISTDRCDGDTGYASGVNAAVERHVSMIDAALKTHGIDSTLVKDTAR